MGSIPSDNRPPSHFVPTNGSFVGSSGTTLVGTVLHEGALRVFTPLVTVLGRVEARVDVELPDGAFLRGPSSASITFEPTPFVHQAQPATVYSGEPTELVLTGFGFQSEDPTGDGAVVVRLETLVPTFGGGRQTSFEVPAVVTSNGAVVAQLPATGATRAAAVSAHVVLKNGVSIQSRGPVLEVIPQVIERISPAEIDADDIGSQLTLVGSGLTPGNGVALLRLTAEDGAPFNQGTSDALEIELALTSHGNAIGSIPNARVWDDAIVTATLVLASGVELVAPEPLLFRRQYADFQGTITLGKEPANGVAVADFDGDQTLDIAFSHQAEVPFVYLNGGGGVFPEELREELATGATRTVNAFDATRDNRVDLFFGAAIAGDDGGGGDPKPEDLTTIAAADPEDDHTFLRNLGLGIFTESPRRFRPRSEGTLSATRFGDYDGDGDADAIFAYFGDGLTAIEVWDGNGFGSWSYASRPTDSFVLLPDDVIGVELGDMNGDTKLDVVVVARSGVSIWRSTGRREFRKARDLPVRDVRTTKLVDLDGDGDLDVVVATDEMVRIFENTLQATFAYTERDEIDVSLRQRDGLRRHGRRWRRRPRARTRRREGPAGHARAGPRGELRVRRHRCATCRGHDAGPGGGRHRWRRHARHRPGQPRRKADPAPTAQVTRAAAPCPRAAPHAPSSGRSRASSA